MRLKVLLRDTISVAAAQDTIVSGLSLDSRTCVKGTVFCACQGDRVHGGHFIEQALEHTLAAVLVDTDYTVPENVVEKARRLSIPVLTVPNLKSSLALLAKRFFVDGQRIVPIYAVTGTNGKTSFCHFFAQALQTLKRRCGLIGTAGYGFPGHLQTTALTTPDIFTLNQQIAELTAQGATAIAIEASSHALVQGRIALIPVDTAIFTNLTPEHLDYHLDMDAYAKAKRLLLLQPGLKHAIINAGDATGLDFIEKFATRFPIVAYSLDKVSLAQHIPLVYADNIQFSSKGVSATIYSPWGEGQLDAAVLGEFNLENLLAVLAALIHFGISFPDALVALQSIQGVSGRMQVLGGNKKPLVVVDYAHSPDALEKVLQTLVRYQPHRLWCVFGCGGNRDREKRPLMGKIAANYADSIVLTNDNPRFEQPEGIIASILLGIQDTNKVHVELDRRQAIAYAMGRAKSGDIILVAGKGHEAYQQIGDKKYPMQDKTMIEQLLQQG